MPDEPLDRGARLRVAREEPVPVAVAVLREEPVRVTVLHAEDGLLLEVRGARLALGARLAAAITVLPLGG